MSWQTDIEQTVTGLGYALVETERSAGGLLRVYIEHPDGEPAITVDDCERVTRQLQYILEVQQVDYQRLEVSSPGLDRPLKSEQDFTRFAGSRIEVTFKHPVEMLSPDGKGSHLQKKFAGRLETPESAQAQGLSGDFSGGQWVLVLEPEPDHKRSGQKKSKKKSSSDEPAMALGFSFDEVREARLVPIVDFKGRKTIVNPEAGHEIETQLDAEKTFNENGDRDR